MEELKKYLEKRISELNKANSEFCNDMWNMSKPPFERKLAREMSNQVTFVRQELQQVMGELDKLPQQTVNVSLHNVNEPICNKEGTGSYCDRCGNVANCNNLKSGKPISGGFSWNDLIEAISKLPAEERAKQVHICIEDESTFRKIEGLETIFEDVYVNNDDDEDCGDLEALEYAHGKDFRLEDYKLVTPKGTPFLYTEF